MRDRVHEEDKLDEALEETFPASDPVGVGGVTPEPDEEGADTPLLDPELAD
jgi:hypothetical protein